MNVTILAAAIARLTALPPIEPNKWFVENEGPIAIASHSVGVIGDKLYAFGGAITDSSDNYDSPASSRLYAYDFINKSWTRKADCLFQTYGAGSAVADGKFYICGGGFNRLMSAYDPVTDTWTELAPPPFSKHLTAMAANGSKIYVSGGIDRSGPTNSLHVYDIPTNSWSQLNSSPETFSHHSIVIVNNKIHVYGGGRNALGFYNYNIATNQWSRRGGSHPTQSYLYMGVASIDNKVYMAGGFGSQTYPYFYVHDTETNVITNLASMPAAVNDSKGVVYKGTLYFLGGNEVSVGKSNKMRAYRPL